MSEQSPLADLNLAHQGLMRVERKEHEVAQLRANAESFAVRAMNDYLASEPALADLLAVERFVDDRTVDAYRRGLADAGRRTGGIHSINHGVVYTNVCFDNDASDDDVRRIVSILANSIRPVAFYPPGDHGIRLGAFWPESGVYNVQGGTADPDEIAHVVLDYRPRR